MRIALPLITSTKLNVKIFILIWVFGRLVLSINTYTEGHMVCYFITIPMQYDDIIIIYNVSAILKYDKVDGSSPGVAT